MRKYFQEKPVTNKKNPYLKCVCDFNAFMDYSGSVTYIQDQNSCLLFKDKIKINIFKEKRNKIININIYL